MITENKEKASRKIIGLATVTCDLLNIRKQPDKNAEILKEVPKGTRFNVVQGGNTEFTALAVNDITAYAMTKFLKVTKNHE